MLTLGVFTSKFSKNMNQFLEELLSNDTNSKDSKNKEKELLESSSSSSSDNEEAHNISPMRKSTLKLFPNPTQSTFKTKSEQTNKDSGIDYAVINTNVIQFLDKYPVVIMNPPDDYIFEENDVLYCIGNLEAPEIEEQIMNSLAENGSEKSYIKSQSPNMTTIDEEAACAAHKLNLEKILNNLEHRLRDEDEIENEIAAYQTE